MYKSFFHLSKYPFSLTPDPGFVLWTRQHREAVAGLTYGVMNRKGMMVLSGAAGTGKTTILTKLLHSIPASQMCRSVVVNPTITPREFLEMVLLDFGITTVPESKGQRLLLLRDFLLNNHEAGRISMLAIDEAHRLSYEVLEEVRLLGNFDLIDSKLLQIVLLGQPELDEILNQGSLKQFKQRIAVRLMIRPIQPSAVEHYIQFRWRTAGGRLPSPFTPGSVVLMARLSEGIPRLVNSICDNALLIAFAQSSSLVTEEHVVEAGTDLHLLPDPPSSIVPVPVTSIAADKSDVARLAQETASLFRRNVRTRELGGLEPAESSLLGRCMGVLWPRREPS